MSFLVWARETGVRAVGWRDASEVAGAEGGEDAGASGSVEWSDVGEGQPLPGLYATQGSTAFTSDLYTLDPVTAAAASIAPAGHPFTGLAFDPTDGTLYGATSNSAAVDVRRSLFTIDPATGTSVLVGQFIVAEGTQPMADIAFDSAGALYGYAAGDIHDFCAIDKASGYSTPYPVSGLGASLSAAALAFDSADVLYLLARIDGTTSLFTIDMFSGAATLVGALDPASGLSPAAATFDRDGLLWWLNGGSGGSDVRLHTLDVATLRWEDVGASPANPGDKFDGLAWSPGGAPSPPAVTRIEFGTGLEVTDLGGGVIRVDGAGDESSGGSTPGIPLEDPGNVWAPVTVVAPGYQIAETIEGELRVFEVVTGGTTEDTGAFTNLVVKLSPLALTLDAAPVTWRYLGIVGQVSWEATSQLPHVGVDDDGFYVSSRSAIEDSGPMFRLLPGLADPGNSWEASTVLADQGYRIAVTVGGALRVFEIAGVGTTGASEPTWDYAALGNTTPDGSAAWLYRGVVGDPDTARRVLEANTAGDADWFLDTNNGSGFRFNQSEGGVPVAGSGIAEFTTDGVRIARGATELLVVYDYGGSMQIFFNGLQTSDPGAGYQNALWNDNGTLKISEGV